MSLRENRNTNQRAILEGRFIRQSLEKHAKNVEDDISRSMKKAGFRSEFWSQRSFAINDDTMTYTHLPQHRFVDMRTRKTKEGAKRKKSHPIHNRIHFGNISTLARQLMYGFTESIKDELMKMDQMSI